MTFRQLTCRFVGTVTVATILAEWLGDPGGEWEDCDPTAVELATDLAELPRFADGPVLLDLSRIRYLAHNGPAKIMRLSRELRTQHNMLVLCCPDGELRELLEILRLTHLLPCYASIDEALAVHGP